MTDEQTTRRLLEVEVLTLSYRADYFRRQNPNTSAFGRVLGEIDI